MSFKTIAEKLVKRGIHVVATYPGERRPLFPGWQNLATTDPEQIEKWNTEDPTYNCISVAKQGGIWILDVDNYTACVRSGMPPLAELSVYTVKSPRESGCHFYFQHDEYSAALGNTTRNIFYADGITKIAEAKFHNGAACSPGCTRYDGGKYVLVEDTQIVPAQRELIDWIERESEIPVSVKHGSGSVRKLDSDFDVYDFVGHFEIHCYNPAGRNKNGDLYFDVECPYKGSAHRGPATCTSFILYKDGGFGFSCLACEVPFRELLRKLEQEYDPYPYVIFEEVSDAVIEELGAEMLELPQEERERTVEMTAEELLRQLGADSPEPVHSSEPELAGSQQRNPTESVPAGNPEGASESGAETATEPNEIPPLPSVTLDPDLLPTRLLSILLQDPTTPDFVHYRARLWSCSLVLGVYRGKDKTYPFKEQANVLSYLLLFERKFSRLPTPTELKEFIVNDEDNRDDRDHFETLTTIDSLPVIRDLALDFVAQSLIKSCKTWQEDMLWKESYAKFKKDGIEAGRARFHKGCHDNNVWGEILKVQHSSWQEDVDAQYQRFADMLTGEVNPLAFKTGFPTLDQALGNLSAEERFWAVVGATSHFKTAFLTHMAFQFGLTDKSVLFLTAEHQPEIILDRMAMLFLQHVDLRVPSYQDWQNKDATPKDLETLREGLNRLRTRVEVPGWVAVRHLQEFNFEMQEVYNFMLHTHDKYQWRALIVDPFDMLTNHLPADAKFFASEKIGAEMLRQKVAYHDDDGLIILTSFQLGTDAREDLRKVQQDYEATLEDYTAMLKRKIKFFSWAPEKFDFMVGIAKWQDENYKGVITPIRNRHTAEFMPFRFNVDLRTFKLFENMIKVDTYIPPDMTI